MRTSEQTAKPGVFQRPASAFPAPVLMGILNITQDSFSDGGRYLTRDTALAHGRKLMGNGADVLDLGAAASNPAAEAVPPQLEIERLAPIVAQLKREGVSISVDSFAPEVQQWAMGEGVDYLNDIQGFPDAGLYPFLAESGARLVVMHSVQGRGRATTMEVPATEIFDRILRFFEARIVALTEAGVARQRLILDPGMGFFLGSDPQASFTVLRRLSELRSAFGLPVLVSVSRKSFLRRIAGRNAMETGPATLAAEIFAVFQGADYIRSHDPGALKDGLAVLSAISGNTTSN